MLRYQAGGVNRRMGHAGLRAGSWGAAPRVNPLARIPRAILFFASFFLLFSVIGLTLIGWRIDGVRQVLQEQEGMNASLREEHIRLLAQRAKWSSREQVVQEAGRRLGLRPAEPGQVRLL